MHMADALLSPSVAGSMWLVAGAALVRASRRLHERADDGLTPLMGMLGAFVFAAQMVNFSIPGTGASGHLGGGLLLAILLGPQAGLVVIGSVLAVQALFFADGGLLAWGANLFNLGLLPCFVAYPLVYRPLAAGQPSRRRIAAAVGTAALVGVLLGASAVVVQTTLSGISSLPPLSFGLLMLPIHAAIGIAEGLATAAIVLFLHHAQPDLLAGVGTALTPESTVRGSMRPPRVWIGLAALLCSLLFFGFGSTLPDGLAWSVASAAGGEPPPSAGLPAWVAGWQQRLARMPAADGPPDPPGSALAGVVGGGVTALIVLGLGRLLRRRRGGAAAGPADSTTASSGASPPP